MYAMFTYIVDIFVTAGGDWVLLIDKALSSESKGPRFESPPRHPGAIVGYSMNFPSVGLLSGFILIFFLNISVTDACATSKL
jgi:hypothetical protein